MLLDDVTLVAFVDGELDPVQARAVERALGGDSAAAARAQALRESAALLRGAYGEALFIPVPERLRTVVAPRPTAWGRARGIVGAHPGWMRLAASVALLLIGASAGWGGAELWGRPGRASAAERAMLAARGDLVQATLESTKSGGSNVWRDPSGNATLVVAPVRTFRDEDARFCREFRETVIHDGVRTLLRHGVACRNAEGRWDTRFYVIPGADPPPTLISG